MREPDGGERGGERRGRETQRERVSESIGNLLFETNILVGSGELTGVCVCSYCLLGDIFTVDYYT